jgi:hypothetical protein
MTKIVMTVKVEIEEIRGERFVVERTIVTQTQDNPRFWSGTVNTDLEAVCGTAVDQVGDFYGRPDPREKQRP